MKTHNVPQKIAQYLAAAPEIHERGYTVVTGVRVRDILLNGEPLQGGEILDLLVCEGSRVRIGIACHPETAKVFNLNLRGMPYVRMPEGDTALPLSPEDDGWLDFPSEACLASLLKSVMLSLSCARYGGQRKALASFRRQAVSPDSGKTEKAKEKIYLLPAVPPELIFDRNTGGGAKCLAQMATKQLLHNDFTPTSYGSAHGLFLRYLVNPFGDVCPELLAASEAVPDITNALSWKPSQKGRDGRLSLAERMKRIREQKSGGEADIVPSVKKLLNTPADLLFSGGADRLQGLIRTWNRSRSLLHGEQFDRIPGNYMPTYREILETIRELRQEFSDDPMLDDARNRNMRLCCETLLILLSDIFLTPRHATSAAPGNTGSAGKKSLKERLAGMPSRPVYEVFDSNLAGYCQAISLLSGCEYPNWVYRSRILPIMSGSGRAETDFTIRFLAAYCRVSLEKNGDHDWNKTLPLMYDLITIPTCIKHSF